MKRNLAILLLGVYLFGVTPMGELLKIPYMVEHYYEHKSLDKDLDVLGFLAIHYGDCHKIYSDFAKDMKLPFKCQDANYSIQLAYFTPISPIEIIECPLAKIVRDQFIPYALSFKNNNFAKIWQPPRLV